MRRCLRALLWLVSAAGLVGAIRQRHEAQQVRRGELPPAGATADVACRVIYSNVAARLADWVPAPPPTPAQQLIARIWSAPLTAIGFVVAYAAGSRPHWRQDEQCYLAENAGGLSGTLLRFVGADANTIGRVVISTQPTTSKALFAHEVVHVRQAERLGPLMVPLYLLLAARYGYRDHPLERAARLGARRAMPNSTPIRETP